MKIMIRFFVCFFFLILLIPVPPALAKGSPDKITITGPGLVTPIEITDPKILNEFNPWDGKFLDKDRRIVTETPEIGAHYEVLFYFKDASDESQLFYALYYSSALSGARGDIYLPQEDEKWYVMNNETIARKSGWLYASPEWDSFMFHLLKVQQASRLTSMSAVASNLITQIIAGTALAIILIVSALTLWLMRHRRRTPV